MWIRKTMVLLAVIASTVAMPSRPALACSCAPVDATSRLGEAPAAFVGTVIDIREADDPGEFEDVVFTFRVDEWVKGDLGDTVEMRSSAYGASCGFEMSPGQQSGIFVNRVSTALSGGLCDRVDADALRLAALPPAAATSDGPISLLVAGSFGDSGLIALDSDGGIVGYGDRPTDYAFYFPQISVCPGSRFIVELVHDETIIVRDVASLEILAEGPVGLSTDESNFGYFSAVHCNDEDASEIFAFGFTEEFEEREGASEDEFFSNHQGVVYVGQPGDFKLFATGNFGDEGPRAVFGRTEAVMLSRSGSPALLALDLTSAHIRTLHEFELVMGSEDRPFIEGLAISPNGRLVAAMDASLVDRGVEYYLTVLDLDADDPVVARERMEEFGEIAWVDDDTIAYALSYHLHDEEGEAVPGEESGTVQLFNARDLNLEEQWSGWAARRMVSIDGVLYGLTDAGVVSAPAATGPMSQVQSFPGSVQGLFVVPNGPQGIGGPGSTPEPTAPTVPPATLNPGTASTQGTDATTPGGDQNVENQTAGAVPADAGADQSNWSLPIVIVLLLVIAIGGATLWLTRRKSRISG